LKPRLLTKGEFHHYRRHLEKRMRRECNSTKEEDPYFQPLRKGTIGTDPRQRIREECAKSARGFLKRHRTQGGEGSRELFFLRREK